MSAKPWGISVSSYKDAEAGQSYTSNVMNHLFGSQLYFLQAMCFQDLADVISLKVAYYSQIIQKWLFKTDFFGIVPSGFRTPHLSLSHES